MILRLIALALSQYKGACIHQQMFFANQLDIQQ
jgi:hypothetical protein